MAATLKSKFRKAQAAYDAALKARRENGYSIELHDATLRAANELHAIECHIKRRANPKEWKRQEAAFHHEWRNAEKNIPTASNALLWWFGS